LLDLVEEPFDQVASGIQIRTEVDRVFAISFRRDVCRCSLLTGKIPDPVRIIFATCQQHRLWKQGAEENTTANGAEIVERPEPPEPEMGFDADAEDIMRGWQKRKRKGLLTAMIKAEHFRFLPSECA
jgi:hypothetical protein